MVEKRLQYALIKGIGDHLEEDLAEAVKLYPKAVDIIEGPLMEGKMCIRDRRRTAFRGILTVKCFKVYLFNDAVNNPDRIVPGNKIA